MNIEERIKVDVQKFDASLKKLKDAQLLKREEDIVELAKMYASDSKAWLAKKDYYTSFSSIAYAHGLLDCILKLKNLIE